jgi:hypothetical protein
VKVKELIAELQKCNPEDLVFFDLYNSIQNNETQTFEELHFSVDDVFIGRGTERGFVYLSEEEIITEEET